MTVRGAVKTVVALAVGGLIVAFLIPIAIGAISGDSTTSTNQSVGETVTLKPGLNATVDSIDGANDSASYTISYDNQSASATGVPEGGSTNLTVSGVEVEIAPTQVNSSYVYTDYSHPTTTGWGAAGSLWLIIPLFLVLAPFLYFVAVGLGKL